MGSAPAEILVKSLLHECSKTGKRNCAYELVETVRRNVMIDWPLREDLRTHLRVLVKRILRKHGYPPDKQEKATQTVLEQTALLSAEWAVWWYDL